MRQADGEVRSAFRGRDATLKAALADFLDCSTIDADFPRWQYDAFDRNLGAKSPLNLPRGPNRLWTAGGLQYSPPFR